MAGGCLADSPGEEGGGLLQAKGGQHRGRWAGRGTPWLQWDLQEWQ